MPRQPGLRKLEVKAKHLLRLIHPKRLYSMTPAWIVYAWPRVLCQAQRAQRLQLTHQSTRVLVAGYGAQPSMGQTLWCGHSDEGEAGVAWDWVQLPIGMVAMVDPMALVSNLQFVNLEGQVLAPMESVRRLNEIVHGLPWQSEVQRVLQAA